MVQFYYSGFCRYTTHPLVVHHKKNNGDAPDLTQSQFARCSRTEVSDQLLRLRTLYFEDDQLISPKLLELQHEVSRCREDWTTRVMMNMQFGPHLYKIATYQSQFHTL